MSEARRDYAIKGLHVMACMFTSTYHETMQTNREYDIEAHNQLFLGKFKDFGYAGSRMDDLLPFYEMYSNTIQSGVPMRKLLAAKTEHVANSQVGFKDFVDDQIMQRVPISKLDNYITTNCNDRNLDSIMKPTSVQTTVANKAESVKHQKPWYKKIYVWIAIVSGILVFTLCIFIIIVVVRKMKMKMSNSTNNTVMK
jgi:hypothetical protein